MGEGGVETDAPIIVAILGETAAPIIASEGVEAVAPIVAISVLHALSLLFVAIVVPKADTPRTRTFMRIFLYGGMIASGVLGTLQEATDVAYSGTPDGSSPRDSPGGSSDGRTDATPRAAPSLVDDASGDGDAAGQ